MPLALFFGTFAWSFAYVSLPFYIQRLNGGDTATTPRWVLAWASPAALYVVLALLGLLCVPCARGVGRGALA